MKIHPLAITDLDFLLETEHHPDNRRFIGQWPRERHLQAIDDPDYRYFLLLIAEKKVGYCILSGIENTDNSLCLKRIAVTEKGKGYGKLAMEALLRLVFTEFRPKRFWLDLRAFNLRAESLYQKMGFQYEGTLRKASRLDGEYYDLKVYSMLREEFDRLEG